MRGAAIGPASLSYGGQVMIRTPTCPVFAREAQYKIPAKAGKRDGRGIIVHAPATFFFRYPHWPSSENPNGMVTAPACTGSIAPPPDMLRERYVSGVNRPGIGPPRMRVPSQQPEPRVPLPSRRAQPAFSIPGRSIALFGIGRRLHHFRWLVKHGSLTTLNPGAPIRLLQTQPPTCSHEAPDRSI